MSQSNQETTTDRKHDPIPWRYLLAGLSVFALLVVAIILPDILEHIRYYHPLSSLTALPTPSGSPGATPTNLPSNQLSQSGTTSPQATNAIPSAAASIPVPNNPSAQLFEAYGRLVTLILAIGSVLALFFGYFVRKSIRETEEDIEKRMDKTLENWKEEHKKHSEKQEEISKGLEEKTKAIDELERRLRKSLEDLHNADQAYATATSTQSDIGAAAEQLTADIEATN